MAVGAQGKPVRGVARGGDRLDVRRFKIKQGFRQFPTAHRADERFRSERVGEQRFRAQSGEPVAAAAVVNVLGDDFSDPWRRAPIRNLEAHKRLGPPLVDRRGNFAEFDGGGGRYSPLPAIIEPLGLATRRRVPDFVELLLGLERQSDLRRAAQHDFGRRPNRGLTSYVFWPPEGR